MLALLIYKPTDKINPPDGAPDLLRKTSSFQHVLEDVSNNPEFTDGTYRVLSLNADGWKTNLYIENNGVKFWYRAVWIEPNNSIAYEKKMVPGVKYFDPNTGTTLEIKGFMLLDYFSIIATEIDARSIVPNGNRVGVVWDYNPNEPYHLLASFVSHSGYYYAKPYSTRLAVEGHGGCQAVESKFGLKLVDLDACGPFFGGIMP